MDSAEDSKGKMAIFRIALGVAISMALVHLFRVYWRLRHVPGPIWAKLTNVQRVLWVKTGRAHEIHQAMHDKYGEVVQFGPNMVSLANPAWIPTVYPIRPGFPKARIVSWWLFKKNTRSADQAVCTEQLLQNPHAIYEKRGRFARCVQYP
jgi:hypothetical protein